MHAAYTELKPEGLEGTTSVLNAEMLARAGRRWEFRELWRVGEPYASEPVRAVEIGELGEEAGGGFPPFARSPEPWSRESLALAVAHAVLGALDEAKLLRRRYELHVGQRAGGYVRVFVENAEEDDSALFAESLQEALGPLKSPRYVIPRHADEKESRDGRRERTWGSNAQDDCSLGKHGSGRMQRRTAQRARCVRADIAIDSAIQVICLMCAGREALCREREPRF